MREYSDQLDAVIAKSGPEDPNFMDDAARGLGSMMFYLLPGLAAAKGVSALAKASPLAARIAGAGFSGGFEALNNAAGVFKDVEAKTGDRQKAYRQAWKAFAAELPADALTNLPLFGALGRGGKIARIAGTTLGQSAQEAGQSVISQYFTDGKVDPKQALYEGAVAIPSSLIMGGGAAVVDPASRSGMSGSDTSLETDVDVDSGGGADVKWPRKGVGEHGVEIDVAAFRPMPNKNMPDREALDSDLKILAYGRYRALQLSNKMIEDPTGMRVYFAPGPGEDEIEYARHLVSGKEKNSKPQAERAKALFLVEETISNPDVIAMQENGKRVYGAVFRDDSRNTLHQIITDVDKDGRAKQARMVTSYFYKDNRKNKTRALVQFNKLMEGWVYLREDIKKGVLSGAPRTPDRPSVSRPEPELHRPVNETVALQQSGVNAGGVDKNTLGQAIKDAGGLNWDSMMDVYGQDYMGPLVRQFSSEEYPGLWRQGKAGLRFADMAKVLQERGLPIETPRDLHRIMAGDPSTASKNIDEKISYGYKWRDGRSLPQMVGDVGRKVYTHVFDREAPVERLVRQYEKASGEKMDPTKNPYLHLGQRRNVHGAIAEDVKGLKAILGQLSETEHDALSRLLVAYRSLDQRNLGIPMKVSAGDALMEIENANPKLKKIQQELVGYQKKLLWKLVESGQLSYSGYQTLVTKWPNYSPFFLDGGADFLESFNREPGKIANDRAALQVMEGTEEVIHDPLESILKNTAAINRMVRENQVAKDLLEMASAPGMEEVLTEETNPVKARRMEGIVTVWDKGKRRYLKVLPDVFNVLEEAPGKNNLLLQIMTPFSRTLRSTAVQHNPAFLVLNPVRDMFTGVISSETGLLPLEIHYKGLKHILQDSDLYREALREGALGGHFIAQDKKSVSQDVHKMFAEGQEAEGRKKYNPLRWIGRANDLMEQAPRMAEYASMRGDPSLRDALLHEFGRDFRIYSTEEASQSARDLSVDFSRFGESTRAPNKVVAFFNAALQGGKKLKDMAVRHPARTFARGVTWITLPSVLLWLKNHDEPWYQELPQTEKDRWWHIMIGDRIYRTIKPFEMGQIFGSIPERLLERLANDNPRAFRQFSESFLGSLGPGWMPTMFGPIIEWRTNYNFFRDSPVVPMREQGLLPEYQFGPETSEVAKWVGRQTGLSPRKIDNTIYGYTSKVGRYATQLIDFIVQQAGGRGERPREWNFEDLVKDPGGTLHKAFSRQPYRNPQSIEDFYTEYARQDSLYKTRKASGKPQVGFNPLKYLLMKKINGELSDIWATRRAVLENDALSGKQKQAAVERLTFVAMDLARLGTGKTLVEYKSNRQISNPYAVTR